MAATVKKPPAQLVGPICALCLRTGHRASKCPDRLGKNSAPRIRKGKEW